MLTGTALYEGTVRDNRDDEFFARAADELEPIRRRFPHARAVRVQRPIAGDGDARPIAMIPEMDFADQAAIEACLASPIREEAHAATVEVMKLFDGRLHHIVAQATVLPPARV